jgi:hypothetical protein
VNDAPRRPEDAGKDFLDLIERRVARTSDLATQSRLRALQTAASELGRAVLGGLLVEFIESQNPDRGDGPSAPEAKAQE